MKKVLFALAASLCLAASVTACSARQNYSSVENWAPYLAKPEIQIVKVERSTSGEKFGDVRLSESTSAVFQDNLVRVGLVPGSSEIVFTLQNKSNQSAKLIWDETVFIDGSGQSSRIMHEGVRYMDKDASSPPAVIPKGSNLTDIIVPSNNVAYSRSSGWYTAPLPRESNKGFIDEIERERFIEAYAQSPEKIEAYRVVLPIEIEGIKHEYTVTFGVTTFRKEVDGHKFQRLGVWRKTAEEDHAKAVQKLAAKDYSAAMDLAWNAAALFPSNKVYLKTKADAFVLGKQCPGAIEAFDRLCTLGEQDYCNKVCN